MPSVRCIDSVINECLCGGFGDDFDVIIRSSLIAGSFGLICWNFLEFQIVGVFVNFRFSKYEFEFCGLIHNCDTTNSSIFIFNIN